MRPSARRVLVLALLVSLAPLAAASDLTLNGQTDLTASVGSSLTISLQGAPGQTAFLLVDVGPGPTLLDGELVPLALSPQLAIVFSGPIPASGTLVLPGQIPDVASFAGVTVYLAGVVLDPGDPNGKDWSNGTSLTIDLDVGAGPPQGAIVGRPVVLDGSAAGGADGQLPGGATINWSVLSAPGGSSALPAPANEMLPVFTPDMPGDYVLRATITGHTTSVSADTTVHAWETNLGALADGGYFSGNQVVFSGTLLGPRAASMTVNGAPVALVGSSFGPVTATLDPGEILLPLELQLTHGDGSVARARMTLIQGTPAALGTPSPLSLAARLNQGGLDAAADAGETELQAADIQSLLLALPPEQVANDEGLFGFTIFSATIDFTGLSYDPDIQLDLVPTPGGLIGTVTILDVRADFVTYGEILEIDYNFDGYMTTSPTTITATLVGSAAGGQLQVDVTNVQVDRQNFDFELTGFFGTVAELFVIEDAVKEDVEAVVAQTVSEQLGPAVQEILGAFVLQGNLLDTLLVDIDVGAPITGVTHDGSGVTILLDGNASIATAEPGSPPITQYYASSAPAPALGALSPGGQPYDAGLALADDFANQVLAVATGAGMLNGDLTTLLPSKGKVAIGFETDELALLLPGTGFDLFPVDSPVTLRAYGSIPPILRTTPGGPAMAELELGNLIVAFEAPGPSGQIPLLWVKADGGATLDLIAEPDGTLSATLVDGTLVVTVLGTFPGANLTVLDVNVGFLGAVFEKALPQIVEALGGIPLPSLEAQGLGLTPSEIALLGAGEHVGFFGALDLTGGP